MTIRYSIDLADTDGGMTADAIADEAEQKHCPNPDAHGERYISPLAVGRLNDMQAAMYGRKKAKLERDKYMRIAGELRAEQGAAEWERDQALQQPRPLTPDDITDTFVMHVHEDYFWSTEDRVRLDMRALKNALRDAVQRAQEPARDPAAERLDPIIDAAIRGHSDITSPDVVHAIADALAEEGVRAPGAES